MSSLERGASHEQRSAMLGKVATRDARGQVRPLSRLHQDGSHKAIEILVRQNIAAMSDCLRYFARESHSALQECLEHVTQLQAVFLERCLHGGVRGCMSTEVVIGIYCYRCAGDELLR